MAQMLTGRGEKQHSETLFPYFCGTAAQCIAEGSKYAHWVGLYPKFHLSWVLGPFVHGRLQNMKTFGHDITSSTTKAAYTHAARYIQ